MFAYRPREEISAQWTAGEGSPLESNKVLPRASQHARALGSPSGYPRAHCLQPLVTEGTNRKKTSGLVSCRHDLLAVGEIYLHAAFRPWDPLSWLHFPI